MDWMRPDDPYGVHESAAAQQREERIDIRAVDEVVLIHVGERVIAVRELRDLLNGVAENNENWG